MTDFNLNDRVTVDAYSDTGTVPAVAHQLAHVEWDRTGASWMPQSLLTEPGRQKTIDVSGWTRLLEIDTYAIAVGVDRATAIEQLVNVALSHGLDT